MGLTFSRQRDAFTHTVDPRVDHRTRQGRERSHRANRVAAMSYVQRAAPFGGATVNGGRAPMVTDWKLAVLVLK